MTAPRPKFHSGELKAYAGNDRSRKPHVGVALHGHRMTRTELADNPARRGDVGRIGRRARSVTENINGARAGFRIASETAQEMRGVLWALVGKNRDRSQVGHSLLR